MKILVLIVHFGDWPSWLEYFLLSCKKNIQVTWLLVSDNVKPENAPGNVAFETIDLNEFNALASKKLGMQIAVKNPYKICDLRPAFGIIFDDFIREVDFWGYSDLDLVYGDFSRFLTAERLIENDVISCRKEYLPGHFTLFKNNKEVNELFMLSSSYEKVFQDYKQHYAFDERSNVYGRRLFEKARPDFLKKLYSSAELLWNKFCYHTSPPGSASLMDMNSISNFAEREGKIKVFRQDMVKSDLWYMKNKQPDWKIRWEKGKLYDSKTSEELLHFHFLSSKYKPGFRVDPMGGVESFIITRNGISPDE